MARARANALLLTDGEHVGQTVSKFDDTTLLQGGLRCFACFSARQRMQSQGHVLQRGEIWPEREILEDHSDSQSRCSFDPATVWRVETGEQAEQRRFASARRTEDRKLITFGQREVQTTEHFHLTEAVTKVVGGEEAHGKLPRCISAVPTSAARQT
jgi:hypothetical protein